jgi:hypothetical protein
MATRPTSKGKKQKTAAKTTTRSKAKKSTRKAKTTANFALPMSMHLSRSVNPAVAVLAGPAHYLCVPSGPPPALCVRYVYDPATHQYFKDKTVEPMDCTVCRNGA